MSIEEIVEIAIQGHASTRDAIRWAIEQEREACAKICEEISDSAHALWKVDADPTEQGRDIGAEHCAQAIRARGEK
jgi:hypothetical protein